MALESRDGGRISQIGVYFSIKFFSLLSLTLLCNRLVSSLGLYTRLTEDHLSSRCVNSESSSYAIVSKSLHDGW